MDSCNNSEKQRIEKIFNIIKKELSKLYFPIETRIGIKVEDKIVYINDKSTYIEYDLEDNLYGELNNYIAENKLNNEYRVIYNTITGQIECLKL